MDDAGASEWLPIQQAAKRLGVSADTIRRRLKRGELASRRDDTPQGYRWLIRVEETPSAPPDAPGSPRTRETPAHGSGVIVIDDGREALIAALHGELANRVREVAELHEVIRAQAKVLEVRATLPASSEAVAAPSLAASAAQAVEPVGLPSRAWWRRILHKLQAAGQ